MLYWLLASRPRPCAIFPIMHKHTQRFNWLTWNFAGEDQKAEVYFICHKVQLKCEVYIICQTVLYETSKLNISLCVGDIKALSYGRYLIYQKYTTVNHSCYIWLI